jgi:hypothetical protein
MVLAKPLLSYVHFVLSQDKALAQPIPSPLPTSVISALQAADEQAEPDAGDAAQALLGGR